MFRRTTTKRTARPLGIEFQDGHGITTQAERSERRLGAARDTAARMLYV